MKSCLRLRVPVFLFNVMGKATVLEALTIKSFDIIHLEIFESYKVAKLSVFSKFLPEIRSAVSCTSKNLGGVQAGRKIINVN